MVPGVVASIQTFGSLVGWHPHLHLVVTDGAFRPDGTFLPLGYDEIEVLIEAFRRGQVARYAARAPIALERLSYDASKQQVTIHSGKREEPTDHSDVPIAFRHSFCYPR